MIRLSEALKYSLIGTVTVIVAYLLSYILVCTGYRSLVVKASSFFGAFTLLALVYCAIGVWKGIADLRRHDQHIKHNAIMAIVVGMMTLCGFAYYLFLAFQSPNFGPIH